MISPTAVVDDSGCTVHDALQFVDLLLTTYNKDNKELQGYSYVVA